MGYLAIRKILDSNNVNYSKRTIIQASDLKAKLDSLHIQQDDVTIISLDIESMYPSTPSLLIKDHKKPCSTTREHPTRLLVPAQNFTSAFPKMGYLAIRKILDSNNVNYSKRTIIQASDLKAQLDSLHIQQDDVTIISLDIEAMYPSIKWYQT
jgi:cell division septal protein FtsQ